MSNRILHVDVRDRSLAAQAEVWISVAVERRTANTEVRGRLLGPHCRYADTIEVAYPLRPIALAGETGNTLTARIVIPEASLWDPESPFLYDGAVELWQDGQCVDRATVTHGLRQLSLGSRGLRVNGRPLNLTGRSIEACDSERAGELRRAGCNLLVASVRDDAAELWSLADRMGFFVLGRLTATDAHRLPLVRQLEAHASSLGWLAPRSALEPGGWLMAGLPRTGHSLLGVEGEGAAPLPPGVHFAACPSGTAHADFGPHVPFLTLAADGTAPGNDGDAALGRVD